MKWFKNLKDWQQRAIKTFIQTGISYITVAFSTIEWDSMTRATWVGICMSALAAALSAVMNVISENNK